MVKDNETNSAESQREAMTGPGARLREAREGQSRSVEDVAHSLHLDVAVVHAIEDDQLDSLGAPVFVRGYLRSYARLLSLPEQDLADAWQPIPQDPEEFRSLSMESEVKAGASLSMFLLWLLLGIVVVGVVLYLSSGDDEAAPRAGADTVAPSPVSALPGRASDFVVEESSITEEPIAPVPERPREAAAVAEAEATQAIPLPDATEPVATVEMPAPPVVEKPVAVPLTLTFNDECWVEVSDATRRLLYGLEKAGSVRSFSAKPPLRFFVGNIDAVSIQLAGKEYTVPRRVRTGKNTARFVLSAEDIEGTQ